MRHWEFFRTKGRAKASAGLQDERGQSTIEFTLTMVLILAFILFFFQLALVFGFGNYVQYATFMSARAYLAAGPDLNDQQTRACQVLASMLTRGGSGGASDTSNTCAPGADRFRMIARGDGDAANDMSFKGFAVSPPGNYSPTRRDLSWLQGVRYTFRSRIFLLPLSGFGTEEGRRPARRGPDGLPATELRLTSESWLTREPTFVECSSDVRALKGTFDNGC